MRAPTWRCPCAICSSPARPKPICAPCWPPAWTSCRPAWTPRPATTWRWPRSSWCHSAGWPRPRTRCRAACGCCASPPVCRRRASRRTASNARRSRSHKAARPMPNRCCGASWPFSTAKGPPPGRRSASGRCGRWGRRCCARGATPRPNRRCARPSRRPCHTLVSATSTSTSHGPGCRNCCSSRSGRPRPSRCCGRCWTASAGACAGNSIWTCSPPGRVWAGSWCSSTGAARRWTC